MTSPAHIPLLLIPVLLLVGGLLYGLFYLLRRYLLPLSRGRGRQRESRRLFRAEVVSWSAFALFAAYRLFVPAPLATLFLFALLLGLGWFGWRDFLPGLFFRWAGAAKPGDRNIYEGRAYDVEALPPRHLSLREETGERLLLPYRLLREVHLMPAADPTDLQAFSFVLGTERSEQEVQQLLLGSPWITPAGTPRVESIGASRFRITLFVAEESIGRRVQAQLQQRLESS